MHRWIGWLLALVLAVSVPAAAQPPDRIVITVDNVREIQKVAFIPDERHLNGLPIAWSPDGSALAVGVYDGAQIYNLTARGFERGFRLKVGDTAQALAYTPDGSLLAVSVQKSGAIYLWNTRTGERAAALDAKTPVSHLAFSPDNRLLASTIRGTVDLWGVPSQAFTPANAYRAQRQGKLKTEGATLTLAFSAASDTVILGQALDGPQYQVTFWDVAAQAQSDSLAVQDLGFEWAVAPDHSLLAFGATSIVVWDMEAKAERATLASTSSWSVDALSLHPDLTLLAAVHHDGTIRLWDLNTSEELGAGKLAWSTTSMAFSPDGTLLAMYGWNRVDDGVHIWGIGDEIPLLEATPEPTPTPEITATPEPIEETAVPEVTAEPVLRVGGSAVIQTTGGDRLNARSGAGRGFDIVTKVASGTAVTIIGGPQTADGFTWWQVRTGDGVEGWVVESAGDEPTLFPTN